MAKKIRKTRKQKLRTAERRTGFVIKSEWLKASDAKIVLDKKMSSVEVNYFSQDLTKTVVLTMLVLAFELALWQYLT